MEKWAHLNHVHVPEFYTWLYIYLYIPPVIVYKRQIFSHFMWRCLIRSCLQTQVCTGMSNALCVAKPSSAMRCLIHADSCGFVRGHAFFFFLKRTRKDQILARSTDCSSFTGARQVPRGAWKKQNLASERSALRFGTWMHHTLLCVCERLS